MGHRTRNYEFYDTAISICSTCFRKVDGKILIQDGAVYLTKRCPEHGFERVLIADDAEYYRRGREVFLKKPEMPDRFNTPIQHGCPYDCGLCPDHEQHSCVSIIELTNSCNLSCPICYAESGPHCTTHRPLDEIIRMLDQVVANEGEPDVVQLSGGEPTIHPDFFAVLDAARERPIRHLMVNTNGIVLAKDRLFMERLAAYQPGIELYLQFDSLSLEPQMELRGADLRKVHATVLDRANELGLSVTLVVTVKKGLNDHELGDIIAFGLEQPCVRGVTFQPIQAAGRLENYDPATDRLTLTEVRRGILEQSDVFAPEDILPVPCHPDAIAMAYALKHGGETTPLTHMIPLEALLDGARNTITYEKDDVMRDTVFKLFSTNHSPESSATALKDLLCCIPKIEAPEGLGYDSIFRVIIMEFIDAHNFDVRSVKKSCVHIAHPDGRMIPFDTYNLFYRGDLEETRLRHIRERIDLLNAPLAPPSEEHMPDPLTFPLKRKSEKIRA